MSISINCIGFVEPNEEYKKKVAAWHALKNADLEIPDELAAYFGWDDPDPSGFKTKIPVHEYKNEMQEGYEIKVSEIPSKVTSIRFYNSY